MIIIIMKRVSNVPCKLIKPAAATEIIANAFPRMQSQINCGNNCFINNYKTTTSSLQNTYVCKFVAYTCIYVYL